MSSEDSGAELARSLPTTVPESPSAHQPRTPRTPRTPGRQDPSKTPRFYPVMKESGAIDGQVSALSLTGQGVETLFYVGLVTEKILRWTQINILLFS